MNSAQTLENIKTKTVARIQKCLKSINGWHAGETFFFCVESAQYIEAVYELQILQGSIQPVFNHLDNKDPEPALSRIESRLREFAFNNETWSCPVKNLAIATRRKIAAVLMQQWFDEKYL